MKTALQVFLYAYVNVSLGEFIDNMYFYGDLCMFKCLFLLLLATHLDFSSQISHLVESDLEVFSFLRFFTR